MAAPLTDPYRLISDNMQDVVTLHTAAGVTMFVSLSMRRVLGLAPERSIGLSPFPRIHPDDVGHVRAVLRTIISGEAPSAVYEFRFRDARGRYIWLEAVIVPVREPDGSVPYYQTSARDITERKQIAQALRDAKERFHQLAALSADWLWESDEEFRFIFHSHQQSTPTRVPSERFLGKTRWELWPSALTPAQWDEHKAILAAHQPFYQVTMLRFNLATGEVEGHSSISGEPYFDEAGQFLGYRGIGKDISERKRAELALATRTAELAISNRRLEREARRRIALEREMMIEVEMGLREVGLELHDDLGQALTGIALLTKALEQRLGEKGGDEAESATRILALVNRTIQHTRMISHGLSPYIGGEGGLISALTQLAADIDMIGTIRCEADLDSTILVHDEVVARSLYRIAQESINNVLKHSRAHRITMRLFRRGTDVHLVVADDGKTTRALTGKFHSLRHRADVIGARLTIAQSPAGGTRVHVIWASPAQTPDAAPQSKFLTEA